MGIHLGTLPKVRRGWLPQSLRQANAARRGPSVSPILGLKNIPVLDSCGLMDGNDVTIRVKRFHEFFAVERQMLRLLPLLALLALTAEASGQEIPPSVRLKRDQNRLLEINNRSSEQMAKNSEILVKQGLGNPQVVNGMINAISLEATVMTSTSQLIYMIKVFERMRGESDEKDQSGWEAIQERFQAQVKMREDTLAFRRKLGNFHPGTRTFLSSALSRQMEIIAIAQTYAKD